jgi:hypothetical protein
LNRWRALFLCIAVWSCNQPAERKQRQVMAYYDIKGLMDEQLSLLESFSPYLSKEALINGTYETQRYIPQDSAWIKELEVFLSADINKPMLVDSYSATEQQTDSGKSLYYISKIPRATLVDSLTVHLDDEGEPQKVHAYLESANSLFTSVKTLEMDFEELNGKKIIAAYGLHGWQKMITKDTMSFNIRATIEYP